MSNIDVTTATYTCRQEDDLAVITILEGADIVSTTVGANRTVGGLE